MRASQPGNKKAKNKIIAATAAGAGADAGAGGGGREGERVRELTNLATAARQRACRTCSLV